MAGLCAFRARRGVRACLQPGAGMCWSTDDSGVTATCAACPPSCVRPSACTCTERAPLLPPPAATWPATTACSRCSTCCPACLAAPASRWAALRGTATWWRRWETCGEHSPISWQVRLCHAACHARTAAPTTTCCLEPGGQCRGRCGRAGPPAAAVGGAPRLAPGGAPSCPLPLRLTLQASTPP